ncbi:hypothetical protein AB3R30_13765 [Leptolyngbyaceae cyanobacterium UHCC 1019]
MPQLARSPCGFCPPLVTRDVRLKGHERRRFMVQPIEESGTESSDWRRELG